MYAPYNTPPHVIIREQLLTLKFEHAHFEYFHWRPAKFLKFKNVERYKCDERETVWCMANFIS